MKNIFFHIGTPKTGTTFLQNILANNIDFLERKGFRVSPRDMLNRVRLMLENESYAERDNSIFLRRIFRDELSRPEKTFIMSHEAYSGMSYLHSESIAKTFAKNLSIFLAGCKTKIIVYLRRQDVLMESLTSSQ